MWSWIDHLLDYELFNTIKEHEDREMLRWILDDEKLIECKMNIRNNATNRQYNTNKMKQLSQCSGVLTINVLCVLCFLASTIVCDVCQFAGCWLLWVIHRQSVADADDTGWVYTASSSSESLTPTLTWCLINESQVKMMGWECCCPIQQLVSFRASFRRHCVCDCSCIFTAAVCSV